MALALYGKASSQPERIFLKSAFRRSPVILVQKNNEQIVFTGYFAL